MTTGSVTTNDINPSTSYAYNYSYLPPLAMVDVVPPAEGFSARPEWIAKVAASALKILVNTIMIGIKSEGGIKSFAEKLFAELPFFSICLPRSKSTHQSRSPARVSKELMK